MSDEASAPSRPSKRGNDDQESSDGPKVRKRLRTYQMAKNKVNRETNIAKLPIEIFANVAAQLQPTEFVSLRCTCQAIHSWCDNDSVWQAMTRMSFSSAELLENTWEEEFIKRWKDRHWFSPKKHATIHLVRFDEEECRPIAGDYFKLENKLREKYPGIFDVMMRGDLLENLNVSGYRSTGGYGYDGERIVSLNYDMDDYGSPPQCFKVIVEFPPSGYWAVEKMTENDQFEPGECSGFGWHADELTPCATDANRLDLWNHIDNHLITFKFKIFEWAAEQNHKAVCITWKGKKHLILLDQEFLDERADMEADPQHYPVYVTEFLDCDLEGLKAAAGHPDAAHVLSTNDSENYEGTDVV